MSSSRSCASLVRLGLTAGALVAALGCHSGECDFTAIMPDTLPDAQVGQPYSIQLTAQTSGPDCKGAPHFELGTDQPGHQTPPPPGLSLSDTGLLSGTPTTAGTFAFSVWATIACKETGDYGMCLEARPTGTTT